MKNNQFIPIVLAVFVAGALGFWGGMTYQKSTRAGGGFGGQSANGQRRNGQFQMMGGRQGFRPVSGEIISADATSITVKLPDNSSRIILVSGTTDINKAAKGSSEDLKVGETVAVFGSENPDGSITAQNIQLNPVFRRAAGAPDVTPAPSK